MLNHLTFAAYLRTSLCLMSGGGLAQYVIKWSAGLYCISGQKEI